MHLKLKYQSIHLICPYKLIYRVDTRRRFNVYKTSIRRLIDVETTSCVYWVMTIKKISNNIGIIIT